MRGSLRVGVIVLAGVLEASGCARTKARAPVPPTPTRDDPPPVTSTLIRLANEDLAQGRWVSAKFRADEALARDPNNADAYAVLGAAYWRGGDFAASTAAFEAALTHDPTNFGAVVALGRNLYASGAHARAIALQDRVLVDEPEHRDPQLTKLWNQYALLDVEGALATLDRLFRDMRTDDEIRPLLLAHAGFLRPLAGHGPLLVPAGPSGSSDLRLDPAQGLRHSLGTVGGAAVTRVVLTEMREEARIDRALAERLGLAELGRFVPYGGASEVGVVIVPQVAFGSFVLRDVPAIVDDMTAHDVGEVPGLLLGRQALRRIGAITYDFPRATLSLAVDAPTGPPSGAQTAPLLLIHAYTFNVPATTLAIDGSPHTFPVFLGGNYGCGVTVTRKEFLKSGHLPRELEVLDDPAAGVQMIYVEGSRVGGAPLKGGVGGLVLANTPPDDTLGSVIRSSGFELGGYLNVSLLRRMSVTYVLSRGELYIHPS